MDGNIPYSYKEQVISLSYIGNYSLSDMHILQWTQKLMELQPPMLGFDKGCLMAQEDTCK